MDITLFMGRTLALLAPVNPIQKISGISSLQNRFTDEQLKYLSAKASISALIILFFSFFLGQVIFIDLKKK